LVDWLAGWQNFSSSQLKTSQKNQILTSHKYYFVFWH